MTNFIGRCSKITALLESVSKVADSDAGVLVEGEHGTGKDLIVNLIREGSKRRDRAFVVVNCGSIPESLAENEFFGHVKGAYTDAGELYEGRVAQADGGILYLDEVSDLDLSIQAKLLRFLQFKVYQPVGSSAECSSDVRVLASTCKDIRKLIKEGKFREDLYYRLNVLPLFVPPLRDREDDIFELTDYFSKNLSLKYSKNVVISDVARIKMKSYYWPGNVRELENLIEREVVLSPDGVVDNISFDSDEDEILPLKNALDLFKKSYIIKALDRNGWNQTRTASALDIQRTYLARLIKEYEINKL